MKKIFVALAAFCAMVSIVHAQSAPRVYTDSSGNKQSVTMASTVASSGYPVVQAYKDSSGNWQRTTVISVVCGVDSNGFPQVCPSSMTQTQADARYLQLSGGSMNSGANITLPNGTLNAGYVNVDAQINAFALALGWGGRAQFTSQNGQYSTTIGLDNWANITFSTNKSGGGGVMIGSTTYANLPNYEPSDGVIIECSDCVYNTITGVQLKWNVSSAGWTTMDNVIVNSQNISTNFSSPIEATDGIFSNSLIAGKSLQVHVPNSSVTGGILPVGELGLELINSNNKIMDLIAGSIYSNWLVVSRPSTYKNLPTSPALGGQATCTDCWSSSNPNGQSSPGIPVYWLNNQWSDALGVAVKHP